MDRFPDTYTKDPIFEVVLVVLMIREWKYLTRTEYQKQVGQRLLLKFPKQE